MDPSTSYRLLLQGLQAKAPGPIGLDRIVWDQGPPLALPTPAAWEELEELHARLEALAPDLPEAQRRHWEITLPSIAILMRVLRGHPVDGRTVLEGMYHCPTDPPSRREVLDVRDAIAQDLGVDDPGGLRAGVLAWERNQRLEPGSVVASARAMLVDLRRRTSRLLSLPPGRVQVQPATGVPWTGFSDYRGKGVSVVRINTDVPWPRPHLRALMAHEAYPGHHTRALKLEAAALAAHQPPDMATWFIGSPFTPVEEGFAEYGMALLGLPGAGDATAFHLTMVRWAASMEAHALLASGVPEGRAVEVLANEGLMDDDAARHSLGFVSNPILGPSTHCYWFGTWAVAQAHGDALREGDPPGAFLEELYGKPMTLGDLMALRP